MILIWIQVSFKIEFLIFDKIKIDKLKVFITLGFI